MTSALRPAHHDRRLLAFLLLSAALHGVWLTLPAPLKAASTPPAPLVVHLPEQPLPRAVDDAPRAPGDAPRAARLAQRAAGGRPPALTDAGRDAALPAPAQPPRIDLEAALATARSFAKESQPKPAGASTRDAAASPPASVEAAVRAATSASDAVVEQRDAAGNWVLRSGRRRCVVAVLDVPQYMLGMTIPAQCQLSKS